MTRWILSPEMFSHYLRRELIDTLPLPVTTVPAGAIFQHANGRFAQAGSYKDGELHFTYLRIGKKEAYEHSIIQGRIETEEVPICVIRMLTLPFIRSLPALRKAALVHEHPITLPTPEIICDEIVGAMIQCRPLMDGRRATRYAKVVRFKGRFPVVRIASESLTRLYSPAVELDTEEIILLSLTEC